MLVGDIEIGKFNAEIPKQLADKVALVCVRHLFRDRTQKWYAFPVHDASDLQEIADTLADLRIWGPKPCSETLCYINDARELASLSRLALSDLPKPSDVRRLPRRTDVATLLNEFTSA